MKERYLEVVGLIERLHRRFLDTVQTELTRRKIDDVNSVQAMILFNIGKTELTVGEITTRGCYHGSNVSYSIKKLLENGYIDYARSASDRRVARVKLSRKGHAIRAVLDGLFQEHATELEGALLSEEDLESTAGTLIRVERVWRAIDGAES